MLEIGISGIDELKKELKQLAPAVRLKISRQALRKAGKQVLNDAKRLTPVDSGALRKSIKLNVKASRTKETASIVAGNNEAWYAHLVERGFMHTTRGKKGNRKPTARGFVDGKGYLRKALETNFENVIQTFVEAVKEAVNKTKR